MLSVKNLHKSFGTFKALNGVSFELDEGDILGFIGPNGAGKTTTIRILAGLSKPSGGDARIGERSVVRNPKATRSLVGYMPDFFGVYENTRVWEYLDFFAASFKIERKKRSRIINDVMALTDLTGLKDVDVEALSRGMKQRVSLARTLLHDPKLLLLDEPASGLDPRARIEIRALLKELCKMGKTILISSHILTELSDLCNKVAIIEEGKLLAFGETEAVIASVKGGVKFKLKVVSKTNRAKELLDECPKVIESAITEDDEIEGAFDGTAEEASIIVDTMVNNGLKVVRFGEEEVDLEDLFMRITKGVVS